MGEPRLTVNCREVYIISRDKKEIGSNLIRNPPYSPPAYRWILRNFDNYVVPNAKL